MIRMSEDGVGVEAYFLEEIRTLSFCCYRYMILVVTANMVDVETSTILLEVVIKLSVDGVEVSKKYILDGRGDEGDGRFQHGRG